MRRIGQSLMVLVAVVALFPAMAFSQVATGAPPFSSLAGGPDVINLSNMNVHWSFPIIAKAGRGIPFNYAISFDNSVWKVVNNTWQPVDANTMGWTRQTDALAGYMTYTSTPVVILPGPVTCGTSYYNWAYHEPTGTVHKFGSLAVYTSGCSAVGPSSASGTATDGSGYTITVSSTPSATVYPPSGGSISPPLQNQTGAASITDTNGNFISTADGVTFTDTLGTNALNITNSGGGTAFPTGYHYHGPNGDTQVWLSYTAYNIQSNFGCSGIAEYGPTQIWLVTAVHYPDGTYTLEYEDTPGFAGNKTGRLKKVTLPTGGAISYSYWGGGGSLNGIFCDGTTAAFHRTVNDGSNTFQTDYWIAENADGTTTTHVITYNPAPQANDETVIDFSSGHETQRKIWRGPAPPTTGGTLKETFLICWNGISAGTCGPGATVGSPITGKFTYTTLDNTSSRHDDYFNSYGLVTETDDYDWGYAYMGKTQISYATNLGTIVNRPASVSSYDAAGSMVAQTNYAYDDYSVYGLVLTNSYTPAVPQHITWQQLTSPRGNLTSVSRWVTGSTYLTKRLTYFDTGVLSSIIDVNGAVTTHNYPTNDPNLTTCGFTFPNSVSAPTIGGITLTTATTWNCDGGVATTTTDPNGNSRSVVFWDANFWRPTTVQDELGFTTNISYTNPNLTESSFNFGGNSIIDTLTTLDGLGRTHIVQRKQSPTVTTYDSVETDYDSYGRPWRSTMPYVGTAGQGFPAGTPVTTTTYDALSRPTLVTDAGGGTVSYGYTNNDVQITVGPAPTGENAKSRQYEYDAQRRLTSVCEITSGTGSGTCAQNTTPNPNQIGYWTKYAYDGAGRLLTVTQNAQAASGSQQTRSFTYDKLGRMLSETNPETGTTNYYYDSGGGCGGTFTGDLISKSDANGNLICNSYDALHRLTQALHYGPAQAATASAVYIYDAATVNGQTMQNAKGRLAEAYTCMPGCASATSVLGYSYSARGEVVDAYESTAHSGGYYDVKQSYWESGAPKQLSNLPALPMITYGGTIGTTVGLDGEGRLTQVTAATGQNPVTGVTYNNGGQSNEPVSVLTDVVYGSTDYDHLDYDPNTGRRTKYTFNVNGYADTGTLTWNANGSLQKLQIADNLSQDFETCNYTHDDLGRIASVNCTENNPLGPFTAWIQNLTYDPFGNITKSGNVSFQPAYASSNRIASAGYGYDANGNLLADATGGHQYQWDADGHPIAVDGVNLIYDAMGRMVEQQRGTSYTQIVYGPGGGKLALMNGQTLSKAFVPLPGGATAVYNSSGLAFYRHSDWLGSSRLDSTPSRTVYSTTAYAPFGENYNGTGTTDLSFTGQNQDTVPGLYDFMFREYSPNQGRFVSADPKGLGAVSLTNPQSWNRYAYVVNNPLSLVDPLGLWVACSGSSNCYDPSSNTPPFGWAQEFGSSFGFSIGGYGGGGGGEGGRWDNGGETLGIPNWLPFPQGSLLDFLPQIPRTCDFGPCGSGFQGGQGQVNPYNCLPYGQKGAPTKDCPVQPSPIFRVGPRDPAPTFVPNCRSLDNSTTKAFQVVSVGCSGKKGDCLGEEINAVAWYREHWRVDPNDKRQGVYVILESDYPQGSPSKTVCRVTHPGSLW